MCGILGWVSGKIDPQSTTKNVVAPAMDALYSRGPDAHGIEIQRGWVLGHTRLAILDLSHNASQPMSDGKGNWLVYNGEIYNYRELRTELVAIGYCFQSSGDTEVLLHALDAWGVSCLPRLRGMFAFAWLNDRRNEIVLARDRYGVKPLAYSLRGRELQFASDCRSLQKLPSGDHTIDDEASYLYLNLGYVPAPYSIYKSIRKLLPGTYLQVNYNTSGVIRTRIEAYWNIGSLCGQSQSRQSYTQHLETYQTLIAEAIELRQLSDVPVGTLFSGGLDSSLVSLQAIQKNPDCRAFTMGMEDIDFDETPHASKIANQLGWQHTAFKSEDCDLLGRRQNLAMVFDEPFADPSSLPTWQLCQEVARYNKVVLSGDGGDECFGGYPWHRALLKMSQLQAIPKWLRMAVFQPLGNYLPARREFFNVLAQTDLISQWSALKTGMLSADKAFLPIVGSNRYPPIEDYFRNWLAPLHGVTDVLSFAGAADLMTYLPDDLMVKIDRASMHVSLEVREPLLDHELIQWCFSLPSAHRYRKRDYQSKLLTRDLLAKMLPAESYQRPKQGFTPPWMKWLEENLSAKVKGMLGSLASGDLGPMQITDKNSLSTLKQRMPNQYPMLLWRLLAYADWAETHQP